MVLLVAVFLAAELNPFYLKVRESLDYWLLIKPKHFIYGYVFFARACYGWNRIIQLSFWDWRSYFSVLSRLFANCSSILTIRGKFNILVLSLPIMVDHDILSVGFCCGFLDARWGWVNMFGFCSPRSSPSYWWFQNGAKGSFQNLSHSPSSGAGRLELHSLWFIQSFRWVFFFFTAFLCPCMTADGILLFSLGSRVPENIFGNSREK